jgi:CheY-like chemotaxis protein
MARSGFYSVESLSGVHVVLVVDDGASREMLASILRYCGALVTAVDSADGALAVIRRVKADALVTEVELPGRDGVWLIRQVRGRKPEQGGVVPAVALVPRAEGPTVEQALAAGFDAGLPLPVDPWQFCRLIASLINVT